MKNTDTPSIERLKELSEMARFTGPLRYQENADAYTHIIREGEHGFVAQFPQGRSGVWEARARLFVEAINALPHLIATLETLPSAGEGEQPDCDLPTAEDVRGILSLPTTEIRRGAFPKAIKALHKCVCFSAFSAEQPLSIRFDFTSEDDRFAAANAIDKAFGAVSEDCPPSRPSFDKWDYAAAALADARCAK